MSHYHQRLLTKLYEDVSKELARQDERTKPSYTNKRCAAAFTVKVYHETLCEGPDDVHKFTGLTEARKWQKAKQFELFGETS